MLHGVGGRTIEEAQANLSHAEFQSWVAYRNKNGSLNVGIHNERMFAGFMALYANAHIKKGSEPYKVYDFAPHIEEPPISLEEAMKTWG